MILKLGLLLSTIGIIACNVPFDTTKEVKYEETNQIQQRNYQHSEYLNSYTEVVYKYETNEVNSVDDLVVGNIYKYYLKNNDNITSYSNKINVSAIYLFNNDNYKVTESLEVFNSTHMELRYQPSNNSFYYYAIGGSYEGFGSGLNIEDYCYVVFYSLSSYTNIEDLSASDYLPIESVIYHQPQTIIGYFNEFLEENLFSEIPYVREMSFNIGGQNINLLTYLIIAFGLIVSVGLLIGLFLLLKWLFKVFANSFILR